MQSEEFVRAVVEAVYQSTARGVTRFLEQPPGRKPRADLLEMSEWYNSLDSKAKLHLARAVKLSADQATFGLLAVIDGVRAIDDQQSSVELFVDGIRVGVDEYLHDIFRSLVDEIEYPD
jgi:hypothetical protein